jgi:hypothetical protein
MKKIKQKYKIGDFAWIYGIAAGPGYNRLTKGTVVHEMVIEGYADTHYVIAISNGIQDLLEVRTWEEISQDDKGPIGSFRMLLMNDPATQKKLLRTGMRLPEIEMNPEFIDAEDNNNESNSGE